MSFEDRILLKLKRKYSTDEEIGLIVQELKAKEFECGILKSELSEKESELSRLSLKHKKKKDQIEKMVVELNVLRKRVGKIDSSIKKDQQVKELRIRLKEQKKKTRKITEQLINESLKHKREIQEIVNNKIKENES